jgi:diguanylate cyclase (GGDEF)-like protein/PAS domain S-box-containing protein
MHQLNMLSNQSVDALALRMAEQHLGEENRTHFKLKNGKWLERFVYENRVSGHKLGLVVHWRDVTDTYNELLSIHHERDLMHSMMDSVPDQIFFKDLESRFIRINTSLAKRYGLSDASLAIGKTDADFYSAEHAAQTRTEELEIIRTGKPMFNQVHHEVWSDGREAWNVSMKMPLLDSSGKVVGTYGLAHDITEHKKAEALIWTQANFDSLTGLPNRRMIRDRWEQAVHQHGRSGHNIALMLMDLDHFKEVNDSLGHAIGDELLKQASQRIAACVRGSDTLARMGGDEFALILTELAEDNPVGDLAQKILESLRQPFMLGDERILVSASIGISVFPRDGSDFDNLLKLSDQAMYEAKALGRNRFSFFTPLLLERAQTRIHMVNDLRLALAAEQFQLVYQPILDLKTGALHKAEALIRWHHPKRGQVSPVDFIPVAESAGLIVDIGEWVFHTAARQAAQWRKSHLSTLQIAVNRSPLQFQSQRGSPDEWRKFLVDQGLGCDAIVVEITEGLLLDASDWTQQQLRQLREFGMRVSLDDFGTGYSSLSYLHRFDIDYVKIDKSFTANIFEGSKNLTLCKAIVSMAHELGIKVVAEGIETAAQRDLLTHIGCDFGQGYYFSHPVAAKDFWLALSRK